MGYTHLSPSRLNLFRECERCFWLRSNKDVKRPSGPFPSLPSGMDRIIKQHFDRHRSEDPAVRRAVTENASDDADLAIRRDGRVVDVGLLTPVEDPGGGADPPLVAVQATLDGGTLTLEHFAGDPLPLDRLTVRGTGDPISLGEGDLTPGESVSVDVPEDASDAVVVYSPPAGDATTVIAEG